MALNDVSQLVLAAVVSRLSDPVSGFNPSLATVAASKGLPTFVTLNFASNSMNFYFGQIDPVLLEGTGFVTYPFACIYILESANTNIQKFNQFSGVVRCVFEVTLSWGSQKGLQNFEAYCSCLEVVLFSVINGLPNQNWGKPLVYNGQMQCKRGPLQYGAQNFRQKVGFSIIFEVHQ